MRASEIHRPVADDCVIEPFHELRQMCDGKGTGDFAAFLAEGQKRGEVSRAFPVAHLAEFMEGLYNTVVRHWAVDLTGPHKLSERVSSAVEFFLRGVRA